MTSLHRWSIAWSRLGTGVTNPALGQALLQAYAEPQRAYHTLAHLQDCLEHFDTVHMLTEHPAEVEIALWFHDAIYNPHAHDNEAQSAHWAQEALRGANLPEDGVQRVVDLIMATCHQATPVGTDACLLVDIDLSILGRPPAVFERYEQHIRAEYAWVPAATFGQRRAAILAAFLERQAIYATPVFRQRYEAQARQNLARSLARLRHSDGTVAWEG
ncbi:MAG: N-methyl-D-aspartate receptor NMDAR2C subunit [Candidatus Tectimicrobiota bacterium]